MVPLLTGSLLFFLGGLAAVPCRVRTRIPVLIIFSALAQLLILPAALNVLITGKVAAMALQFAYPIGTAYLRIDPLAAFFILLISLGGLLFSVYSSGYMKMYSKDHSSYNFFAGLLITAMLAVVMIQNALLFLIAWEIMSLASFFLVNFEHEKETVRQAAVYYLVAMQVGAAFLIIAFAWGSLLAKSMDFADFRLIANSHPAGLIIFVLFFIGFGTKAGFVPMHTWLPKAHPAAPTGVSALMSGVMIKTGIYGILRMLLVIGIPHKGLAYMVFAVALISGILGVMNAIAQHDLKKLLAYHSIENIGIIGMGIGLGMMGIIANQPLIALAGFLGAFLHIFNHFTFKSLLFYGAGIIYSKTHTRQIEKLGGLVHVMPYTTAFFLFGSLAISGLPLLNGFISEFAIYLGLSKSLAVQNLGLNLTAIIGLSGLAFIGVMAVLCFTKVFGICFLGSSRTTWPKPLSEASVVLLLPMALLTIFMLFIGLFSTLVLPLFSRMVQQFLPSPDPRAWQDVLVIYYQLQKALLVFAGLIALFSVLRLLLLRGKTVTRFKTWDCGYQQESSRLQYTASSFAASFLALVSWLVPQEKHVTRPDGFFPGQASYESHSSDVLEQIFIRPPLLLLRRFLALFTWIQSGKTQQYILYGLVFLIILISWIIGVRGW